MKNFKIISVIIIISVILTSITMMRTKDENSVNIQNTVSRIEQGKKTTIVVRLSDMQWKSVSEFRTNFIGIDKNSKVVWFKLNKYMNIVLQNNIKISDKKIISIEVKKDNEIYLGKIQE